MKRVSKILCTSVLALSVPLAVAAQQTITFGPNKGQPVQTQNMIDTSRHEEVVQKIGELTVQVRTSADATNKLLLQLIELQTEANKQQLAALQQRPAPAAASVAAPVVATPAPTTPANQINATPEMLALQRTMISRLDEQTGLLKLISTLINKMAEEQKWSNTLMQSTVEGKKR